MRSRILQHWWHTPPEASPSPGRGRGRMDSYIRAGMTLNWNSVMERVQAAVSFVLPCCSDHHSFKPKEDCTGGS